MSIMKDIKNIVEEIALELVSLDSEDIPALGNVLNRISSLEEQLTNNINHPSFLDLVRGLKGYIEKIILRETDNLKPLGDGISCIQSICNCLDNEQKFEDDISSVLEALGIETPEKDLETEKSRQPDDYTDSVDTPAMETGSIKNETTANQKEEEREEDGPSAEHLDDDERAIVEDFIIESLENLGTIEVALMDLEQNPEDLETINAIFRPFHTVKGVSGFLNLKSINELAHSAENLLDKARNGEIRIEGEIIDIILESVDMLKNMVEGVREGLEKGGPLHNGLDIMPLKKRIDDIISQAEKVEYKPVGEILIEKGTITHDDLEYGLKKQKNEPNKKIMEILIEEKKIEPKQAISVLREQKRFGKKHVDLQVKVDTKKLDDLINLTGELAIVQSMLKQNISELSINDQKLFQNLGHLNQISSGLQTTAMSMRMVPIKSTFQKMVRLVRDLAKNSGKEVSLEMYGEETEIDRNVVEELYDPMVHMIRNAVDHGIETPEEREKAGKNRKGTVYLRAYHKGGNIVVEIEDDGRGLDKERILEKAIKKNLITDEDNLSDSEIYNLIFEPGFSTAQVVTDISGRGVGMDVVKKGIERLRGRVEITSAPGRGSTFLIRLPLTLAIIDGMVVRVAGERYIIPTLAIMKSFRPEKKQYSTVKGKGEMILSQGKLIPLIRLDHMFGTREETIDPWEGLVVTVQHENNQMCILLDELLGKEEVVIKSLGEGFKSVKGIAGGAIMGDGRVGLILDMGGLFEIACQN